MPSRKSDGDNPVPQPIPSGQAEALVPDSLAGERLDKAAAALFAPHSRARLQQWIAAGQLTLDGAPAGQRRAVQPGQRLSLTPTDRYPAQRIPQAADIPLTVLHSDPCLLILNKPAGLVSHPAPGHPERTLVNALLHLHPALAGLPRAGLVHRLDKDTTGLMAVARNEAAWHCLTEQLRNRSVARRYLALVRGEPTAGDSLTGALGRHPTNRLKMAVRRDGRPARTDFRIRQRLGGYTELEVRLQTGRTHQIRVHLTAAGLPLIGDALYGGGSQPVRNNSEAVNGTVRAFGRQALHAFYLGLTHPHSGEAMHWQCEPPQDYLDLRLVLAQAQGIRLK